MTPHAVDGSGNGTYELIKSIDASLQSPTVTIKYKFKAKDGLGDWTVDSNVYVFYDTILCGP
jgi:hypothetical protein